RAGLIGRRVARQPMIVCASPSYLESNGHPETPEDLAQHSAVVYRRSGPVPHWLFPRQGQSPVGVMPFHRFRLDDLDAIADAAIRGMGLAWLPYWLVRGRIETGTLVRLLPEHPPFLYECHAVWLQTPHLPRKVRVAVDALAAQLPSFMTLK
ncbi:LysR substrate-binding domain-containing protein, partial [Sinorhizobium meliloti]